MLLIPDLERIIKWEETAISLSLSFFIVAGGFCPTWFPQLLGFKEIHTEVYISYKPIVPLAQASY